MRSWYEERSLCVEIGFEDDDGEDKRDGLSRDHGQGGGNLYSKQSVFQRPLLARA